MSDSVDLETRLINIQDSLDSIHQRMDRFYAWAGLLQSEFRNMKQRTGFIEAAMQEKFDFTQNHQPMESQKGGEKSFVGDDDDALWARMMRINGKTRTIDEKVT